MKEVVEHNSKIVWEETKPDETMRKLMDIRMLQNLRWRYRVKVLEGVHRLYKKYISNNTINN